MANTAVGAGYFSSFSFLVAAILERTPFVSVQGDRIAAISGLAPMMLITRPRLLARTCRLISVLTRDSILVWKCVAPIHAVRVSGC